MALQLAITGKQVDIGTALQEHVKEHLTNGVTKYFDNPDSASVSFSKSRYEFICDIQVHVKKRTMLRGEGRGGDAYSAFHEALQHITKRLRRNKKRILDEKHHKGDDNNNAAFVKQYVLEPLANVSIMDYEDENYGPFVVDNPLVISEEQQVLESLTVGAAVSKMDMADLSVLLFKNSLNNDKISIVYIRKDGNVGWIEPEL